MRERVCCLCKSKFKRMSSWKTRIYIGNPCYTVGSKCARQNKGTDVVVSTNHVKFLTNRLLRLISLPTSAIFVLETSGITTILKYISINPIHSPLTVTLGQTLMTNGNCIFKNSEHKYHYFFKKFIIFICTNMLSSMKLCSFLKVHII